MHDVCNKYVIHTGTFLYPYLSLPRVSIDLSICLYISTYTDAVNTQMPKGPRYCYGDTSPNHHSNSYNIETLHSTI